jgi:HEAT repeat protein
MGIEQNSSINERIETLKNMLKDPDEGVRQKAAESLSRLEALVNFDTYTSMLNSDDRVARIQAIYLLGELATERAIELLQSQITDPYDDIRAAVIQTLRDNSDNYRTGENRRKAVDVILRGLEDLNPSIRASAADALARYKDPRAVDPLLAVVRNMTVHESEEAQLAASVILALGELGDKKSAQEIIERVSADNLDIKEAALKALGMLGDLKAKDCLIESLTSDNARIRMQAVESLGRL